jgi:hypothetical protein
MNEFLNYIYSIPVIRDLEERLSINLAKCTNLNFYIAKKSSKMVTSEASYSSRLLLKHNGEWLDRWFMYHDGTLAGYKDSTSTKPAEVILDVRNCKLTTLNHRSNVVKNLNLFQVRCSV